MKFKTNYHGLAFVINGVEIDDDINRICTFNATPTQEQLEGFEQIKYATMLMLQTIRDHAPECASRTIAMQHVVDARMRANAAIETNAVNFDRDVDVITKRTLRNGE